MKDENNKENSLKDRVFAIVIATLAIILVFGVIIGTSHLLRLNKPSDLKNTQPSEFPDYSLIKGENPDPNIKSIKITIDCPENGCVNNKSATQDFDGIVKKYKVIGKLSRAYLYTDLFVDHSRPLSSWDDFYFMIGGYGGHIIVDENSLPTPPGESSVYLFNLKSVSYYENIKQKELKKPINNINIFSLLQDGNVFKVHASISSDRPGRVMREVSIYYECQQDSECEIQEIR